MTSSSPPLALDGSALPSQPQSGAAACLQSPEERLAYQQALDNMGKPQPKGEDVALTTVKKSLRLIECARLGDAPGVALWLSAGANPNYRAAGYVNRRALDHAIASGSGESVVALMEAGAALTDATEKMSAEQSLDLTLSQCEQKASAEVMSAITRRYGSPSAQEWADRLMEKSASRLDVIEFWLKQSGGSPSDEQWERLTKRGLAEQIHRGSWSELGAERDRIRNEAASFIASFAKSAPPSCVESLFAECAWRDHKEGLMALMEAGLRPSPDWSAPLKPSFTGGEGERAPLLSIAALGQFSRDRVSECFALLSHFEPAMEAAKRTPMSPNDLACLSISAALKYAQRGLPLNGVNKDGETVAHRWAAKRPLPDGWKSFLKAHPDLVLAENTAGKSAFEILLSVIRDPDEREEYKKALASSERQSLMKESKASAPKPAAKSAPKTRL